MTDGEGRLTFPAGKLSALRGEANRCAREFIPTLKDDLEALPPDEVLRQVAEKFGNEEEIDLISFRLGMYALAIELGRLELEAEKVAAGMRFIV